MAEAPRNRLPSGYDDDFVNAIEDELLCLICHSPLREPDLTRCGHRFCKECLEEHFRRQEAQDQPLTCPADREGLDRDRDVFPDKPTKRKILSLAIKCPSEGCDWTGELRSKEVHLASCLSKLVPCTNKNCHVTMQRRHLENHVAITCQWKILKCDHCTEPHPKCKIQDHIKQCSKFPVACPNSCAVSIPREMIPNHIEFDCPVTMISCSYEKLGCETKIQRVQLDSHLQSATRLHLDLACVKLTNTEAKLNDTEAKLNDTEAKLNDTDAKLNDAHIKLNETQEKLNETKEKLEATRKVVEKLETRIFTWRIDNFSQTLRQAKFGGKLRKDSIPFYTDRIGSCGYKLKARIYPNGYGSFTDSLVVFIVAMQGEYDAILPWPFKNTVKMTLIDQQEDPLKRENDTRVLAQVGVLKRPVNDEHEVGACLISHSVLHSKRYLEDDTLFLQFEISPL